MLPGHWRLLDPRVPQTDRDVLEILLDIRGGDASFLNPSLADLEVYLDCCGMGEGSRLMAAHLRRGSHIVLVGDYDCDGITSTTQMALYLREIGYNRFDVVFPERSEGYGLPTRAVLDHPGAALFVAMDCGTHDVGAITAARSRGADCLVIDHHEVDERHKAPATVLINPKQSSCPSRFKELCAAGLTLLFLAALRKALNGAFPSPSLGGKYLALAALGTIADLVPLVEGNRIIARSGLAAINTTPYLPLRRLIERAGLSTRTLNAGHVSFQMAPRINAAGRMASPRLAYDLLMSEDLAEVDRGVQVLNGLNQQRQDQEVTILKEIAARLDNQEDGKKTLVVGDPGWPPGLVGIVASRAQQELRYGPSVIFSIDPMSGIARGSARSVPGFDLRAALEASEDLLLKWGGHKMAAGMVLSIDRLEAFAERFETVAADYPADTFIPAGRVDMLLPLDLLTDTLLCLLDPLEPHGYGNAKPTFAACGVKVCIQRQFGKTREHLSIRVNQTIPAVFWRGARRFAPESFTPSAEADIVFQLDRDQRRHSLLLNIKDIGPLFRP